MYLLLDMVIFQPAMLVLLEGYSPVNLTRLPGKSTTCRFLLQYARFPGVYSIHGSKGGGDGFEKEALREP